MLKRMRRSASLLMALFAGHLSMVASGAVCVVPGMQQMNGAVQADGSGQMAGMSAMVMDVATAAVSDEQLAPAPDAASSDTAPCTAPVSGACVASMPCISALGADAGASIALPPAGQAGLQSLAVTVPASSGAAPDIPPPRA